MRPLEKEIENILASKSYSGFNDNKCPHCSYTCKTRGWRNGVAQHLRLLHPDKYVKISKKQRLLDLFDRMEKAYGGCQKCYGKGYGTYRHGISDGHSVSKMETKIIPCSCSRGKQLRELLKDTDKLGIGIT